MPDNQQYNADHAPSILIVDDDENILELLSEAFELCGLNVRKASNGLDGWHLFKRQKTDIVLTDIQMPGLDGEELSNRIRNHSPNVIIGAMTGCDASYSTNLLNAGIVDYFFMKPFSISYVCRLLTEKFQTA